MPCVHLLFRPRWVVHTGGGRRPQVVFSIYCIQAILSRNHPRMPFQQLFPHRTEEALTAIQQISEDLAQLRSQQAPGSAVSLMYSQAGVHYGRAMLCNAGSRKVDHCASALFPDPIAGHCFFAVAR